MSLLAIDMGSSSCKGVAFSDEGQALAQRSYFYSPERPRPSWAEMAPEKFWEALRAVTHGIAGELDEDPIQFLCISSHGETFIPVDSHQRPVSPAILNVDNRAVAQAAWLARTIGRKRLFEITGLVEHPMYPVAKIAWLRENKQEVLTSAKSFLALTSYLLTRLGLPSFVDYSLASRFLAFDVSRQCWSDEVLSACGLSSDQLPTPVQAGTVAGRLSSAAASELGLSHGTLVVVGGHDQPCGALGMGVIDSCRVSASLGTYECLVSASESPAINDASFAASLNTYCHVVPQRFVTLAYFPSGIMIEWFLRLLSREHSPRKESHSQELYELLEKEARDEPTGLSIMPHLLGSCNPDFNPFATGVIAGLRPTTSRSDLYKGILEGIACEFASATHLLEQAAGRFSDVYVSGGGCRSRLGLKLRAAIAARRLHRTKCSEAVCLGTAILCGVGAGIYSGFREAVNRLVLDVETIFPDPALTNAYGPQLEQHRLLYSGLASLRNAQAICTS